MGLRHSVQFGKDQFPALTGIRAMGAAAVFFVHLPFQFGHKVVIDVMAFFFVLSGFLIVYIYYENAAVKTGKLKRYFINRFARIYPLYFLLVTVAIIIIRHNFSPVFLFKNYTLTHALFNNIADRAIQPSWSITTEECFYLLAPVFMYLIRRFNFWIALLAGFLLLGIALSVSILPIQFLHTPHFVFSITFFGHFFEFFCGIFLALLMLPHKKQLGLLPGKTFTLLGSIGVLAAIGELFISNNMNDPTQATQFILINNFILPVAVAVFYYGLMREKSRTASFLSLPLLQVLGRTSYALYLVHMLVIESVAAPFIKTYFLSWPNLYVLVVFVLTQIIAFLLFALFEQPVNIYIRKHSSNG